MTHGLARLIIRLSAVLAPRDVRARWREEWLAELDAAAVGPASPGRLRRALGAPVDALAMRQLAAVAQAPSCRAGWYGWRGDLTQSLRLIARSPGHTAMVVFCLGAGLSVCVSVFSIVNSLLWGELPGIQQRTTLSQLYLRVHLPRGFEPTLNRVTTAQFQLLEPPRPPVAGVASEGTVSVTVRAGDEVRSVIAAFVSGNYFDVLGTRPYAGRLLTPADDAASVPAVVVGHRFWRNQLGATGEAVGRFVQIGDRIVQIVGIAPDRFMGWEMADIERGRGGTEIWLPLSLARSWPGAPDPADAWLTPIVRHAAAATREGALGALRQLEPALGAQGTARMATARHSVLLAPLGHPADGRTADLAVALVAILAGPLAVLAIACANVANLRLARATARSRELAVRLALGASRWQVTRLLVIEVAIVAALAVLVGWAGTHVTLLQVAGLLPMAVVPDWRVGLFAAALAVGVLILTGLAPARLVTGRLLSSGLRQTPQAGGLSHSRTRSLLVGGQVAVSLALLIVGALFARSALRMTASVPQVADEIVVAELDLDAVGHDPASAARFARELLSRLDQDPRVGSAALAASSIDRLLGSGATFRVAGASDNVGRVAEMQIATPGWFDAMDMRIVAGRVLSPTDRGPFAVINHTLADQIGPGAAAIGRQLLVQVGPDTLASIGVRPPLATPGRSITIPIEIVGVVTEAIQRPTAKRAMPRLYLPLADPPVRMSLVVRGGTADALLPIVGHAIASADGRPPWAQIEPMRAILLRWMDATPYFASVIAGLGLAALGLAMAGLYAVVSYVVSLRTREIGLRMAVGARPGQVVGLMVGHALRIVGGGVIAGLLIAVPTVYLTRASFVGISPADPLAILPTVAGFLLMTTVASAIPARRAARVDPVEALRQD